MRCLDKTGYLNFRMRAMIVSFAAFNLWQDWKYFSHHLAKNFLIMNLAFTTHKFKCNQPLQELIL
ncbi:MAG: hypothetical protein CM15mP102_01060 [Flavobacteriales bacterium]|nr:MAG: hypothetical protein CM15mP102_01060 [Flavobacteriales bacterium]